MPHRTPNLQEVFRRNVERLMLQRWGVKNTTRLGREARIGTGGAQRVLAGKNVGLHVVERVARCFGLSAWQLLLADLDVARPQVYISAEDSGRFKAVMQALQRDPSPGPARVLPIRRRKAG
jgi:hypothetical protein